MYGGGALSNGKLRERKNAQAQVVEPFAERENGRHIMQPLKGST